LVTRSNKFQFDSSSVAWSKDGRTIAVAAISDKGQGVNWEVFLVDVENGQIRQLTTHKFRNTGGLAWLGDGSGLTMIGAEHTEINAQMWHVSIGDGSVRKVNSSLTNYGSPIGVSSDSSSMMAITSDSMTNLWIASTEAPVHARQITNSTFGGAFARVGIVWLADGRIVSTGHSNAGGNPLWITDADGKTIKQLTPNGSVDTNPSATADSQTVVFSSNRGGALDIWRIDLAGNDLRQLTFGGYSDQPSVSPDGKWVVYVSEIDGTRTIWRVPLAGGTAEKIAKGEASWVRVSPDGQFIACAYEIDGKTYLAMLSIDGGEPLKTFELASAANLRYSLRWTPDGRSITYRDWENGYWRQSIDGGAPQRIPGFPEEKLFSYDWSPDGKQIAFGRGDEIRDVILVRDLNR
jgi:Tol biopolymer transport system component